MFNDSSPQGWYKNLPPISRSMLTITFFVTLFSVFGLLNPWNIIFDWELIIKKVQIWRFVTNFFFIGPFSLGWIMSQWMFTSFSSKLEKSGTLGSSSGAYLYFILCLMTIINIIGTAFEYPTGKRISGSSLIFAIIYYWSKKFPTSLVNIWGFTLQAYQLPYALIFLDVLTGNSMIDDIIGLLAGHSYYYTRDIIYENNNNSFIHVTPIYINKFVDYTSDIVKKYIYDFSDLSGHPNVINANNRFTSNNGFSSAFNRNPSQPQAFTGRGFRLGND
ncbi:multi-pass transmembrane protein [Cryptosporidium ryanae]|uniref:multi-pass transmembrane protein n=1 Tax=Cryptosporidium ryanae TaxID=515981 RepID=UPI00351AB118|nr:multi-pass transmembrane protein [Cryptosporidium ryanae]